MQLSDLYQIFLKSTGVVTDSRKIIKGSLFFALKGDNFNGNVFAKKAIEDGAIFAVIDEPEFNESDKFILVDDVLKTLQKLANYHRKELKLPVLTITGTNGKTTTKELINCVLSKKFRTLATQGNLNNHIGVPLTLLSMTKNHEFGIVETGANHQGEIAELCEIAEPDFGLITNIGTAHIEGFGSFEGVIKTKTEMYRFLEKHNGLIFYNYNNEILKSNLNHSKCISYGTDINSDYRFEFTDANPFLTFKFSSNNEEFIVNTNLFGGYNLENNMAAVCVGLHFGVAGADIKNAIENYFPKNNRSQIQRTERNTLFLDMYNANPTSMNASVTNFAQLKADNKVLIIGDMFELGEIAEDEHKKILKLIENYNFYKVYFVGKEFWKLKTDKFLFFTNSDDCAAFLKEDKTSNSTILIKGSRGIHLENVVAFL